MESKFTYSLLQYKHDLSLGESINIGILFYFSDENQIEFIPGNVNRVKSLYPDIDLTLFNSYLSLIKSNVNKESEHFQTNIGKTNLEVYIHRYILAKDAAGFVFNSPKEIKLNRSKDKIINEYASIFLPGI